MANEIKRYRKSLLIFILAEREGLTRAILALALRARYARPKSLLRFCRTPFFYISGSNPSFVAVASV